LSRMNFLRPAALPNGRYFAEQMPRPLQTSRGAECRPACARMLPLPRADGLRGELRPQVVASGRRRRGRRRLGNLSAS
jgi:hypothetical protein